MITDEDMQGYLENLLTFELEAESTYRELARLVSDGKLKVELERLSREETEHAGAVVQMQRFLKK